MLPPQMARSTCHPTKHHSHFVLQLAGNRSIAELVSMKIILLLALVYASQCTPVPIDSKDNFVDLGEEGACPNKTSSATTPDEEPISSDTTPDEVPISSDTTPDEVPISSTTTPEGAGIPGLVVGVLDATIAEDVRDYAVAYIEGAQVKIEELTPRAGITDDWGMAYWGANRLNGLVAGDILTVSAKAKGYVPSEYAPRVVYSMDFMGQPTLIVVIYLVPITEGYVVTLEWELGGEVEDYDLHLFCRDGPKGQGEYVHLFYGNLKNYTGGEENDDLVVTLDKDARPGRDISYGPWIETAQIKTYNRDEDFCAIWATAFNGDFNYYAAKVTLKLYKRGLLIDTIATDTQEISDPPLQHKLGWYVLPGDVRRVDKDIPRALDPNDEDPSDNPWLSGVDDNEFPYGAADEPYAEYDHQGRQGQVINERDDEKANPNGLGGEGMKKVDGNAGGEVFDQLDDQPEAEVASDNSQVDNSGLVVDPTGNAAAKNNMSNNANANAAAAGGGPANKVEDNPEEPDIF